MHRLKIWYAQVGRPAGCWAELSDDEVKIIEGGQSQLIGRIDDKDKGGTQ
jgi:hypothetical protein